MANISGTAASDTLVGTADDDLIQGLDGNDNLTGGVGNDRLEGGAGEDSMNGGEGNDLLIGGGDRDSLYDNAGGNDELEGGDGSDDIRISRADGAAATVNRMDGGAGNDFFGIYDESWNSTFNVSAGDDNDYFYIRGAGVVAIDLGAGNDFIELEGITAAISIAMGNGGIDRVHLQGRSLHYTGGSITVTGFDTGDAGDSFDLVEHFNLRFTNWDYRSSPFTTGHLRLVQSGPDALLQVDWNGGGDGYVNFITFVATSAASLTAFNIGGWPSDGSIPAGLNLIGDAAAGDKLSGGAGDDVIQGLGGADEILGGAGDDRLEGGSGNDSIYGGLGDDLLEGGEGNDSLNGDMRGVDVLRGGEGNDYLAVFRSGPEAGWIELDGGNGDDQLNASGFQPADNLDAVDTHFRLTGGEGSDILRIYRASEVEADAGAGDDLVDLDTYSNARITLGAGSDTLKLDELRGFSFTGRTIIVTDFQAGPTGDRFEWSAYLASALPTWNRTSNPFGSYLRLVQSGADTLLQISNSGSSLEFQTLITLQNVDSSALGQFNMGGFPPDGSAPVGGTLLGTPNADNLIGSGGGDTIYGFGADDELRGGGGDDFLYGGDGRDGLIGEYGDDRLEGGSGMDFLEDRSGGNDSMYGVEGRDSLYVERSGAEASTLFLDGGVEGDWLRYVGHTFQNLPVTLTMLGGSGGDEILINGTANATIDAGTGNDVVILYTDPGTYGVTLGEGSDELQLLFESTGIGTISVADFQSGDAGDRLGLNSWFSSALIGWDGALSPFSAGYARLVESGGATLLQVDRDGGGDGYSTLLTLANTSLFSLTAVNLGGFDLVTKGTLGADQMTGTAAADLIHSGPGNDVLLLQQGGNDSPYGGEGSDVFYFGGAYTGGDRVDGGAGRDVLVLQGHYAATLSGANLLGIESVSLQSGSRATWGDIANNFYSYNITAADDFVATGQEMIVNAQSLRVGENFIFNGSAEESGRFLVYGGFGSDQLTGGGGNDAFFFEGSRWGAFDSANGGGGRDALIISGNTGVNHIEFLATSLASIESISLNARYAADPSQKPSYELVLHDNNVAAGETLIVNGISLIDPTQTVNVDGSAETNGNFILFGGAGNDVLKGGAGADILYGVGGADTLTGLGGNDFFRYDSTSDSTAGAMDHILDFETSGDRIDLSRIDANTLVEGDQAFHWIGSNAFTGAGGIFGGQLRAYEVNNSWFVEGDVNGDAIADFVLQVEVPGVFDLIASSFVL